MKTYKIIIAFVGSFFILYLLALTYRYEPVAGSQTNLGTISVWDRWYNRVCIVSIGASNKPMCNIQDMAK
jgi:hypothetical protein